MMLLSSNLGIYKFNISVHNINIRHKLKLHKPATRLTVFQRSVYFNCKNINNKLPDAQWTYDGKHNVEMFV
jgi:hypothetical protein